ncbi:hypothetical protein A9R00_10850 [Oleispira antarctica]|uniref:Acyl-CoA oxidase/dehydrogenase middle domain-containing protein n=1 Tax=Oleispira antarctica TaxID=188908 RepID=A0A1Y5HRQ1_OLEAN|nr:hypothetical protein A9R00_10850 [Oleispira antarctica]
MSLVDIEAKIETRLLKALQQPLLAYCDIETFRQQMAASFQHSSTQQTAFFLGAQSATPGMAFLAGYQAALRCLDPLCPSDQFAAFCVSEKGIKKPWDMKTQLDKSDANWQLNGRKGFVMLVPDTIDQLYVVAKRSDGSLSCVQLAADSAGITIGEPLSAPFVKDIPHAGIHFDNVIISAEQILTADAHLQANKPFRYWEDVHVTVAMAGWMLRQLAEMEEFEASKALLREKICQLIEKFKEQPDYYSVAGLDIVDECHKTMEIQSKGLGEKALKLWQVDRLLLQMGFKIRHQIRLKLASGQ